MADNNNNTEGDISERARQRQNLLANVEVNQQAQLGRYQPHSNQYLPNEDNMEVEEDNNEDNQHRVEEDTENSNAVGNSHSSNRRLFSSNRRQRRHLINNSRGTGVRGLLQSMNFRPARGELERTRRELVESNNQVQELQNLLDDLKIKNDEMKEDEDEFKASTAEMNNQIIGLLDMNDGLVTQCEVKDEDIKQLNAELVVANDKLVCLRNEVDELRKQGGAAAEDEGELVRLRKELEELKQSKENEAESALVEVEKLKADLTAALKQLEELSGGGGDSNGGAASGGGGAAAMEVSGGGAAAMEVSGGGAAAMEEEEEDKEEWEESDDDDMEFKEGDELPPQLRKFVERFSITNENEVINKLTPEQRKTFRRVKALVIGTGKEIIKQRNWLSVGTHVAQMAGSSITLPKNEKALSTDLCILRIMKMLIANDVKWTIEMIVDALPLCLSTYKTPRAAVEKSFNRILENLKKDSEGGVNLFMLGISPLASATFISPGDLVTWKDRITNEPVDCSTLTGTGPVPNIDSAWNHANGTDGTIIDGFDTELKTKEDLMGLFLSEKAGHAGLLRSNDRRLRKVGILSGSGWQSDGCVNFAKAIVASHKKRWGKDLFLYVYVDQNGEGYGILQKYRDAGLSVKLVSTYPALKEEYGVVGEYKLSKKGITKLKNCVKKILGLSEEWVQRVKGAKRMVNIEQLLTYDTCDVASLFIKLAEKEMDVETLNQFNKK